MDLKPTNIDNPFYFVFANKKARSILCVCLLACVILSYIYYQIQILNIYKINTPLNCCIIYGVELLTSLYLILIIFKRMAMTPVKFFMISSVFLSVIYFVLFPPLQTPDSQAHFSAAYRFSSIILNGRGENEWKGRSDDADFYDKFLKTDHNPKSSTYAELYQEVHLFSQNEDLKGMPLQEDKMKFYSFVSYLPLSMGFIFGRVFHLSPFITVYLAKFLLLCCYIITIAFAIKKIPVGKNIMALTALLPMSLMLSSAFSYDGCVILSAFAFIAAIFQLKFQPQKYSLYECLFWAFILGAVKGGGYIFLLLLAFMLMPIKNKVNLKSIIMILMSGIISILLFNVILVWGQELFQFGVQDNGQMMVLDAFNHPIMYLKMLINTYVIKGRYILLIMGGAELAWLEYVIDLRRIWWMFSIMIIMGIMDWYPKSNFTKTDYMIMGIIILLAMMVLPIMLLSSTTIGSTFVEGVQGRYYLPFLPLALMMICQAIQQFGFNKKLQNYHDEINAVGYVAFSGLSVMAIYDMLNLYLVR